MLRTPAERQRRNRLSVGSNDIPPLHSVQIEASPTVALRGTGGRNSQYAPAPARSIRRTLSAPDILSSEPSLQFGNYGLHQGMFVGDVHNESNTMAAFNRALPGLAGKLDVILLEYYPKGESPVGKSVEEIEASLRSFDKFYRPDVAKQVHEMSTLATKNGIDIRGIDVPTPAKYQGKGNPKSLPNRMLYTAWRTGEQCNLMFLGSVDRYAAQNKDGQSVSFSMFVGRAHLSRLKKLAPEIKAYEPFGDDGGLKLFVENGTSGVQKRA